MANTTFVDNATVINAAWLNDVNDHVYYDGKINVKTFGATGDGTTDDSTAIQAAIDHAITLANSYSTSSLAGPGVEIYFPSGSYLVGTTLVADYPGIAFVGDAGKGTEIKGDVDLFDIGDYTITRRVSRIMFKHLHFIATNTASTKKAIKFYRTTSSSVDNCVFRNWNYAIDCERASTLFISNCSFSSFSRTAQCSAFIRAQGTDETSTSGETYTPGGGWHITDCEFNGAVTGGAGVGVYDTTDGILLNSIDGFYITQSHFTGCVTSIRANPLATAANHYLLDLMLINCYFDEPSTISSTPRNISLEGTVKQTVTMADGSTQSSSYQGFRLANCYLRGANEAVNNLYIAVTDGDSWWDYKKLKDILITNCSFRQSTQQSLYIRGANAGYIEPYGVVIDGNYFEENNSSGNSSIGAAIHAYAESIVVSKNVVDTPSGASDYGIIVFTANFGNDQDNPSAIVTGNNVSFGTYSTEPVRVYQSVESVGTAYITADNIYAGAGRTIRQQYKLTTTNATSTDIWTFPIPSALTGEVTVKITGANSTGSKAVAYQFYAGFRNNGTTSSLSSGSSSFTSVRTWNPDGIATVPTATLATNTLKATVTGVSSETWTWSCLIELSACN